jgi:hypothetical protein
MGWILPAISIGAGLLGAKKQSDASKSQNRALGNQQRIIDEILMEARGRRAENAPMRSAAQARFMELLGQGAPGFDPGAFRDQSNPFRANFGNAAPVAARAALPAPTAPAAAAPDRARMDKIQQALAGIAQLKIPDGAKMKISDKLRNAASFAGMLPG